MKQQTKNQHRKISMGFSLGIIFIVVITGVLIFTSVNNARLSERAADDAVHSLSGFYLKELGERRALTISNQMEQITENVYRVFKIAKERHIKTQKELREFLASMREIYGYERLAVVDENDIVYTDRATMSTVSRYNFLEKTINEPTVFTANQYGAHKQMILAIPLEDVKLGQKALKLSFIQIDLAKMLLAITEQTAENETMSDIYNKNGQNITSTSSGDNILQKIADSKFTDGHRYIDLVEDFRKGKTGYVSYKSGNVLSYMYYTPVPNTSWIFTVTIHESSIGNNIGGIRDEMMTHNGRQLAVIIISMLVAFSLFFLYSRHVQKEEKKRLVALSRTDAMTGLFNRGGGENMIRSTLESHAEGLFLLLDADNFKSVNDTYGHDIGDLVIIAIANTMKRCFRGQDVLMRLGGDEFAVYAVGLTDRNLADNAVERFFGALDAINIPAMGGRKIHVSVGAVFWNSIENLSFDELYKSADNKLYLSKNTEGNMVTF